MIVEILLFLALLLAYFAIKDRKPKGMPPGPFEFPFLGHLPYMRPEDYGQMQKMYGDVVTNRLGSVRSVKIFDDKIAREALAHADFANRPPFFALFSLDERKKGGVASSNGHQWQHDRRFVLRNLRNLGMGKSSLEAAINIEAEALVEDLKLYGGKPMKFPNSLKTATLNIIWQMVAGKRYDLRSDDVTAIYDATNRMRSEIGISGFLFLFFPSLNRIIPKFIRHNLFKTHLFDMIAEEMRKIITKELDEQELKFKENENASENLIFEYLKAMNEAKDDETLYRGSLIQMVNDMFGAGSDTVANMLRWVVFLMAKYPEVTQRLQRQIDEVVPRGRLVSLADKPSLPLVEAYTTEALRFSSMVPFNVQREAVKDTSIAGYFVPKGTQLIVSNYFIHNDERIWTKPEDFSPDRFITAEGKYQAPKEGFFAFGAGKRVCPGETLARQEFFLFTAALLQNFTILVPEGLQLQDEFRDQLGVRVPRDQEFIYQLRA